MLHSPVYAEIKRLQKENERLRAQLSGNKAISTNKEVVVNGASPLSTRPQSSGGKKYIQGIAAPHIIEESAKVQFTMELPVKHYNDIGTQASVSIVPASSPSQHTDIQPKLEDSVRNSIDSYDFRRLSGVGAYRIVVRTGLVANLPACIQYGTKHKPCAVFSVLNSQTKETCWSFLKSNGQLRSFDNAIRKVLGPLIKTGEFRARSLPTKDMYISCIPWKVDVRNDMLNAYFCSISDLKSIAGYNKRTDIQRMVEQALAALWLHDIVEYTAPIIPYIDGGIASSMSGCLMTRLGPKSSWVCKYCYINGAYFTTVEDTKGKATFKQIPLKNAHIKSIVVFFDATENDERYLFEIHDEKRKIHRFTAESQKLRLSWIKFLMSQIAFIEHNKVDTTLVLANTCKKQLPLYVTNGLSNSSRGLIGFVDGPENYLSRHNSSASIISVGSTKTSGYSLYDELNNEQGSSEGNGKIFDGDEFYMQISKTEQNGGAKSTGETTTAHDTKISRTATTKPHGSTMPNITISEPKITHKLNGDRGPAEKAMGRENSITDQKITAAYHKTTQMALGTVFGVPPKDCKHMLEINKDTLVPSVVGRCVQCLMQPHFLCEIGIFRISGSQRLIDDLQKTFDTLGDLNLVKTHVDAHTTADLMKRYLRTLSRGSFGEWPESKTKRVLEMPENERTKVIRSEIGVLNRFNRDILKTILSLLVCISNQESRNNMSVKNLGLALSPALRIPSPILQLFITMEARENSGTA